MARPASGPLGNAPRDLRDDFVGAPAEEAPGGPPMRWPPNPKKIKKDTFHSKVTGNTAANRPDRYGHYRRGGWVKARDGGAVETRKKGGSINIKHPGALHRDMGVPQGQKIPKADIRAKLARDKASGNTTGIKRDVFALNFGKGKK